MPENSTLIFANNFMKRNSQKQNLSPSNKSQGFTLMELLVGMSVTTIVAGLVLQSLVQVQTTFTKDQKKVENGQKMSSVLEIIGREIRQAGELIVEPNFPTIKITPLSSGGASIIIYRAISEPISICQEIAGGTSVTELPFAIDTTVVSSCKVPSSSITSPSVFPTKEQDWVTQRGAGSLLGVLYRSTTRKTKQFVYDREVSTTGTNSMSLSIGTVAFSIPVVTGANADDGKIMVGDTAYLVTKKEYLVCPSTSTDHPNELIVRTNSLVESNATTSACSNPVAASDPIATVDTIATNIDRLNITTTTRPTVTAANPTPSPDLSPSLNGSFPIASPARNWQNIQGIKIVVKAKDPLGDGITGRNTSVLSTAAREKVEESFTAEGSFYPRNALSSK
jgi:prepilin-type N-terminal cleavage/methylation domain-containing protein